MSAETIREHHMTNSHILVQEFDYVEPASLEEAISSLKEHGDRAQLLAGGTFLLVQMKMERSAPQIIINVAKLPGLTGVAPYGDEEGVGIGALTTIHTLRDAPLVQTDYTALAEACAAFGSTQIQMMGTLGGNLCNGSPASDTVPALLALDAHLVLVGPDGERTVPVEEFLVGPGQVALREGELLTSVRLPLHQPGTGSAFIKISRVEADLAKASGAAVLVYDGEQIIDCRLALGSVGPTVLRARRAEEMLIGQPFSGELILKAARIASEEVSPIDDVRSTAWYRRQVVKAIAHDVLQLAWQRAGESREQPGNPGDEGTRGSRGDQETGTALHVARDEEQEIELTVNGVAHRLAVRPNELLINVLRERLQLTGTKYGCGIGECGACTVHLNGRPALSCLVLAVTADGSEVLTVEGLQGPAGELDPLQEAFIEHGAFQCGYCTPGMLMMTRDLLNRIPSPTEGDVRAQLRGNRCRCTGFTSIVRAVLSCTEE